jgi:hypothetical protein
MAQLLSGTVLDDLAAAYVSAVESFQKTAHSVFSELGARGVLVETSSIADTSLTADAGISAFFFFFFFWIISFPLHLFKLLLQLMSPFLYSCFYVSFLFIFV